MTASTSDQELPEEFRGEMDLSDALKHVKQLFTIYRLVLRDVRSESIISVKGAVLLYAKALWWELNVLALPVIGVINFIIWILNNWSLLQRKYIPVIAGRYLRDAASTLWAGDIPAAKFITLRFAIKAFTVLHIRRRLRELKAALNDKDLEWAFSETPDDKQLHDAKEMKAAVRKFDVVLGQTIRKTFFLFLVPYVPAVIKLVFEQKTILEHLKQISWCSLLSSRTFLYFALLLIYTFMAIVSSFVAKREIFKNRDVYTFEWRAFSKLRWPCPSEFAFDLIGYVLLFAFPLALDVSGTDAARGRWGGVFYFSLVLGLFFGFLLWRRVKTVRRQQDRADENHT